MVTVMFRSASLCCDDVVLYWHGGNCGVNDARQHCVTMGLHYIITVVTVVFCSTSLCHDDNYYYDVIGTVVAVV